MTRTQVLELGPRDRSATLGGTEYPCCILSSLYDRRHRPFGAETGNQKAVSRKQEFKILQEVIADLKN